MAIIILGAAGCGAYFYLAAKKSQVPQKAAPEATSSQPQGQKQPADETAAWKVYSDKKYGFQFKYPADWSLETQDNEAFPYLLQPNKQENCAKKGGEVTCDDSAFFGAQNNEKKLEGLAFLEDKFGWQEDSIKDFKERQINGQTAFNFTHLSEFDASEENSLCVQLPDSNFFCLGGAYLTPSEKEILQKIFSTFKFTK